ncbi:putative serine protease K12H4.7 [Hyposmocoma kahamanoa]|uniref:putative serine protease K12H4.7 n=1 Tax=Hyposmocoma kahamanoa TaxID=1477025 RepID=UPI000E6D98D4|nr:putative serine protease K12H4.7 [Hyposmocoma kahamanoa]
MYTYYRYLLLLPLAVGLRTLEPPPPVPASRDGSNDTVTEGFIYVRLNQFAATNTDVFPMRYYYNSRHARSTNIVIFIGGEWRISEGWMRGGLAYELAARESAALFYTEHRYYGDTRPTNTTSPEELKYLSVDQALADLAQFIQTVQSDSFENGWYRGGKVALVGCSYAGSMGTWMRLAYPHLVDAVFSDSGPLHAQEDFPEYLEVIAEALRVQGGETCLSTVQEAMVDLVALLGTPDGPATVSEQFNTCSSLQGATALDLATFFWYGITETFAYLVQYATPGDISNACTALQNTQISTNPVTRLAAWISAQPSTQPCIEAEYRVQLALHTNTSYDAPQATMRVWLYQTCVEYGWYQSTTSPRQPFLSTVPLEYFHQMCKDFISEYFDEDLLRSGIQRTNLLFAGLDFLPDRVISVVGGHDPWSPMGPKATHSRHLAPVYVVPEISHCRAIQSTENSDSEALAQVQHDVLNKMSEWLTDREDDMISSAHAVTASIIVGFAAIVALFA